jgi:hypothetical protein
MGIEVGQVWLHEVNKRKTTYTILHLTDHELTYAYDTMGVTGGVETENISHPDVIYDLDDEDCLPVDLWLQQCCKLQAEIPWE